MNKRRGPKTVCPACGSRASKVTDGRDIKEYGPGYWRRRVCLDCGAKYRTEEVVRGLVRQPEENPPV